MLYHFIWLVQNITSAENLKKFNGETNIDLKSDSDKRLKELDWQYSMWRLDYRQLSKGKNRCWYDRQTKPDVAELGNEWITREKDVCRLEEKSVQSAIQASMMHVLNLPLGSAPFNNNGHRHHQHYLFGRLKLRDAKVTGCSYLLFLFLFWRQVSQKHPMKNKLNRKKFVTLIKDELTISRPAAHNTVDATWLPSNRYSVNKTVWVHMHWVIRLSIE